MCGILGFIGRRSFDDEAFERALDVMAARGPDDRGVYQEPEVLLGHRRLAVLDLSLAGHQPMASPDGRYVITYNGEVYNFRDLRAPLEEEGVRFRSNSDTEVVLALYWREGPNCLQRLRGMFAMAVWDRRDRSLFLARDRMGIKPLYVWRFPGGVAFASEVKALQALPGGPARVNPEAVAQFLLWGSVPGPMTIAAGVECLPPAAWAMWKDGQWRQEAYWELPTGRPAYKSRGEAAEAIGPLLKESVRLRCIADAPLGAFLSGGVDSSAVVSLMRETGQRDIRTFSMSFPQTDLDEGPYAMRVAEEFGTLHTNVSVTEGMVRRELDGFFWAMDQPTCDGVNTYLVSKFARMGGLTVSLCGLGGDELFGGYPGFRRAARLEPWVARIPRPVLAAGARVLRRVNSRLAKAETLGLPGPAVDRLYMASRCLFTPSQVRSLLSRDLLSQLEPTGVSPLLDGSSCVRTAGYGSARRWATCDPSAAAQRPTPEVDGGVVHGTVSRELRCYMHNQLLRDSDVFGMAHSLEIRVPLVDHLLVEAVFRTPASCILDHTPKGLLLESLPVSLPRLCTHRPKMGFTFPFDDWLRGPWGRMIEEAVGLCEGGGTPPWLSGRGVRRLWEEYRRGRVHWSRPWSLFVLCRGLGDHRPRAQGP
jgi:asparagine synthase (glutamine-hydrolysing)